MTSFRRPGVVAQAGGDVDGAIRAYIARKDLHGAHALLAETYLGGVFQYCLKTLNGDLMGAEDVTQEVFEAVCKQLGQFRGEASVRTWLFRIAHHRCVTHIRSAQHERVIQAMYPAHQGPPPAGPDPAGGVLADERDTLLHHALATLAPEERSMVVLYFGLQSPVQLTLRELAEVFGVPRSTLHRQLQGVLHQLRTLLQT
ncbi:MAG: RNA polymerase sigma factor [Candidatus Tectomicrobia bacterium]|nr:RNA polymerase sigma factor [Candidatus Tectomicrobia bacterium]